MTAAPRTVAYGDHPSQRLEVWEPAGRGPAPVAFLLHGGYWRDRYDLHLMDGLGQDLAARGWLAVNVEYRRVGDDGGGWPATFGDGRAARAAVDSLERGDPGRVVPIGHSAGGHLALLVAAWSPAAGAIALAPVSDVHEASRRGLSDHAVHGLLGGTPEEHADRYASSDPRGHLPLGCPVLVVHGDDDANVPVDLSDAFVAAARAAGDDVTYHRLAGGDHFVVIDPASRAWRDAAAWLDQLP